MAMAQSTPEQSDSRGPRLSARELSLTATETVEELTNFPAESVSGIEWDGESWRVDVEVCELERVPNTTDVMATYEVQLDEAGRLLGFRRTGRYVRGAAQER
jgi:hypothetical protein